MPGSGALPGSEGWALRAAEFYSIQVAVPPAVEPQPAVPAFLGKRWAGILCSALLVGLGLHTAARWLGTNPELEKIFQQPIRPADFVRESPDLSAPDPGDTP